MKNGARSPMGAGITVQKAKDFKGTLKRLVGYLKPHIFKIIMIFLMAMLSTIFSILSPKVMGKATNKIFEGVMLKFKGVPGASINFTYIYKIVLILIGLYIISAVFAYLQQYIMAGVAQNTVREMRKNVDEKLSRLPLKFYDSKTNGEILSRVTNDIDNISTTLQQSITQLITSIITIIGIVIMMFTISPVMTFVTFLILPISILVTRPVISRSQKFFSNQQRYLGELNGHVEEMYTGHKVIKAFNREDKSIEKFNDINNRLYDVGWKAQFISGIIMPIMNFISNVGYVAIAVIGGIFVTKGRINIGDIQAFIQYSKQFTQPINQTANIVNILQSTIASAERVFELLDEQEEIPNSENAKTIDLPQGNVKFESVDFGYKEGITLIKDMNIDVKRGQTIAIVGPTGAGKTTLINLLMRFYEINKGKISIDGIDIRDIKRENLRNIFGMVLQDTWLFNGTIRENIAYGCDNATEEEIIKASKAAHADYFIRTLQDGYDTVLNEEASNISQGQKQLLTIARAILSNPSILILDEATSSVDTRTELYIQKAMDNLMNGRTSFVIAHRLSTIKNADLILVMKDGSVIEQGNHNELMNKNGFYADLYNSQFNN
ncbi:ABC transporter ATP-binding protein [Clostridium botulinum]|uniref:ABC transporter n=1 Tax=Clostridium botulinum TaxID=1491 RepID=A0A9Q1ZBQ5_CLOBO|nr:ABC transporter ATP-binding protein [Clostridium botulinum]AEB75724.1 ABC transporter, transmembrane region [Clostridium botulinum BKT015925]KEI02222.1 ABC transporter [Clostridium botulinum D str. 16868]KEI02444.1 ABC transporter [Clostridium botulinum C/D str. Sp77]KLU76446.1 ABC transporter [Clostridium botulinum V891]KOA72657.1 ABC transporter [Clostridium botulinum]